MKSYEKLDWKLIAAIEPNSISQNLDFETLQNLIRNISSCNIENETDIEIDSSFTKVFKLSQNIIKYLLSAQDCLIQQIKNISEEFEREKKEKVKLENDIEDKFKKKISKLKSELQQKEELIAFQNNILKSKKSQKNVAQPKSSGAISINSEGNPLFPCNKCNKMFSSTHYLQSHLARRHPQVPMTELFPFKLTANNNLENFDQNQILKDLSKELEAIKEASIKSYSRLQNLQQKISTDPIQSPEKQLEIIAEQMEIQTKLSQSLDQALSFIHQTTPTVDNLKDKTQNGFSLEKQISDLKLKLESRDDENVRLLRRLREAEQQIKEYQMGNNELMSRVKKDEGIKRQLKEEFDLKLELLKEEQKMETKLQFERLQNSMMHEMKLMHLKQLETDQNVEDIKRMRLPGNVLGRLEDDTDDHIAQISYQSRRTIQKEEVKAAESDIKREQKLQTNAKLETFENQEEVKPSETLIPQKVSGKEIVRTSQMSARPTYGESTKVMDNKQVQNSLKNSGFSKKSLMHSAVSLLKHKDKSLSEEPSSDTVEMKPEVEYGSSKMELYPLVVMQPIKELPVENKAAPIVSPESWLNSSQIEDCYSQMPNFSMEEIRSMVDQELEQRMAYYGLEKNSSEITTKKYMDIIHKMNEEVSHLSPDIQEQYLAFKISLEKDLEYVGKVLTNKNSLRTNSAETKEAVKGSFCLTESKDLSQINQFRESQSLPNQPKPSWVNPATKSHSVLHKATSKASNGSKIGNISRNAVDRFSAINNNHAEEDGNSDDDNYDVSLTTISESDIQKTTNPEIAESNNFDVRANDSDNSRKTLKSLPPLKKSTNSDEDNLRKSISPISSIWTSAEGDSPHMDDLYSLGSDT